jgi:methylthioribose-1-phosphate isomerase
LFFHNKESLILLVKLIFSNIINFLIVSLLFFRVLTSIEDMLVKDISDNRAIGKYGAEAILSQKGVGDDLVHVITHCNTGSLATAGYGTALGIIRALHEAKRVGKFQGSHFCY